MRANETPEGRSVRVLRVGEQVRHALSDVLMRGDVHDDVLTKHSISVTEVRMSPDLRHATAFVKTLGDADEAVAACVRVRDCVEPNPRWQAVYADGHERFRQLYPALRALESPGPKED